MATNDMPGSAALFIPTGHDGHEVSTEERPSFSGPEVHSDRQDLLPSEDQVSDPTKSDRLDDGPASTSAGDLEVEGATPLTVAEVLLGGDHSVRLGNCVAANEEFFSCSVAEALARRAEFTSALMRIPNVGRKTANEALYALEAYAEEPWARTSPDVQDPAGPPDPNAGLHEQHLVSGLRSVLERYGLSVRLANVLARGAADGLTLRDFLTDPGRVRSRLLDCKNSGRKTASEAMTILLAHAEMLGERRGTLETSTHGSTAVAEPEGIPDGLATARDWVAHEVECLDAKQVEVLNSRYGLDGRRRETLQEIAERVHVTRERVRQVEAKALERLGKSLRSRAAFRMFVDDKSSAQWSMLLGDSSHVLDGEVSERQRDLDPWFVLATDVLYRNGVPSWLAEYAFRAAEGWYRTSAEADSQRIAGDLIRQALSARPSPIPLETLQALVPGTAALHGNEGDGWSVFEGYACTGRVGSRVRRTIRMHAVACAMPGAAVFDMATLARIYRQRHPEDGCMSRMFEMQASEAPHLFAQVFDGIWLFLHDGLKLDGKLRSPPFERGVVEGDRFAEGSIGDRLVRRLADDGPQRLIDLRTSIAGESDGSIAESSVGAILVFNPCFRRVAPGIFGLQTGEADLAGRIDHLLLDERQCRSYCQARHGGAPSGYYPAWSPRYEMRLAAWARRSAPTDLFRSLMSVIDPSSWPASPSVISEYQELSEREGRWEIGASRRFVLGHRFMDPGQAFAVLAHLAMFGSVSWFAVNRVTGSKTDNHDAADILAFLVMAGLVGPVQDWQACHVATHAAWEIFSQACSERRLGTMSWNVGVLAHLLESVASDGDALPRGWVARDEVRAAAAAWRGGQLGTGRAFGDRTAHAAPIDVDDLFESDDWNTAFGA